METAIQPHITPNVVIYGRYQSPAESFFRCRARGNRNFRLRNKGPAAVLGFMLCTVKSVSSIHPEGLPRDAKPTALTRHNLTLLQTAAALNMAMGLGLKLRKVLENVLNTAYLTSSCLGSMPSPSIPSPSCPTVRPRPSSPTPDAPASSSSAPILSRPRRHSRPPTSYSCSYPRSS